MGNEGRWDSVRRAANVVGALFQVGMTVIASAVHARFGREAQA